MQSPVVSSPSPSLSSFPSSASQWFVLNDTTSGRLHLRLEWLSLITDQEALLEVSGWQWLQHRKDCQGRTLASTYCVQAEEKRVHFCLMVQIDRRYPTSTYCVQAEAREAGAPICCLLENTSLMFFSPPGSKQPLNFIFREDGSLELC